MDVQQQIFDLARKVNGVGIVCGLEVQIGSHCTLIVTEGFGITSLGLLIHYPGTHFKYYSPYDKEVAGLIQAEDDIEVWELISEFTPGASPLTPQTRGTSRFIDNKVFLLYVENDPQGDKKILAIDKEGLWDLLKKNYPSRSKCFSLDNVESDNIDLFDYGDNDFPNGASLYCATNRNTSLLPISMMRFGFATDEKECRPEYREFKLKSADFKGIFSEYELIIVDALEKLQKGIRSLHSEKFHDIFPEQQRYFLDKYFLYLRSARFLSFKTGDRRYYIQIFHDLIKDLVRTYNELVKEVCALVADCCTDEQLFPWHLLLGEISEDVIFGASIFRSSFQQPPIYNNNRHRLDKIRFLHWRLVVQIKNFYIPFVEKTDLAESHFSQIEKNAEAPALLDPISHQADQIKITPSFALDLPLGQQAIPFYYYVANDVQSIHLYWSFEATQCCKTRFLLTYHADHEDGHTNECWVERPLAFQHAVHYFYRIEGVIGQEIDIQNLINDPFYLQLRSLRIRFNLGFKVKLLNYSDLFFDDGNDGDYQIDGNIDANENLNYLGAEHIGGVINGATYILLVDDNDNRIVADFWVP